MLSVTVPEGYGVVLPILEYVECASVQCLHDSPIYDLLALLISTNKLFIAFQVIWELLLAQEPDLGTSDRRFLDLCDTLRKQTRCQAALPPACVEVIKC